MKICFITTGNEEKVATMKRAIGLAEPLIDMGHEVHIISLDCEENRKRFYIECPRATIHYIHNTSVYKEIVNKRLLIKKIKPDFIYVCAFVFRNFICKYNIDRRTLIIVEHSELFSAIPSVQAWKRKAYLMMEWVCKYLYCGQIAASRYLEKYLKAKLPPQKQKTVFYSPYAYSYSVMLKKSILFNEISKKYSRHKIVLYMGLLRLNYGFSYLIEAAKYLKESEKPVKILIMGNGVHKGIAENMIQELKLQNVVELLGYVKEEDLSSYFSIADAFVSPLFDTVQDWARCPSKLFMYLPFNQPIITCKIGEAKELFSENYKYYYKISDSEDLYKKILEAVYDTHYVSPYNEKEHEWTRRAIDMMTWINGTYERF